MTFVGVDSPSTTAPSASQWKDYVQELATEWALCNIGEEPDWSTFPATFAYKTPQEFRRDSGMSEYEFTLFATLPGEKLPISPGRAE